MYIIENVINPKRTGLFERFSKTSLVFEDNKFKYTYFLTTSNVNAIRRFTVDYRDWVGLWGRIFCPSYN